MSNIANTEAQSVLLDEIEYYEFERVDLKKPWLGIKTKTHFILDPSILTYSGQQFQSSGQKIENSKTEANLITSHDYRFKIGAVIIDRLRKETYSIVGRRWNRDAETKDLFFYRLELEWVDIYDNF